VLPYQADVLTGDNYLMGSWQKYLDDNQQRFVDEMLEFLSIPSVSSLPAHAADVQAAAEWVARRMEAAGIENIEILPTGGHPVVYGDWLHAPGKPTILIYGHFDTQPTDPEELWTRPPFEPTIDGDRIYARGASDDKGNMFVPIVAFEALLKSEGALPVNVKFLFEGQEEIGSPQLPPFMEKHRERFACDLAVSADGGQWAEDQPHLSVSARGLCALQVDVIGPSVDLHSGIYGGTVQNPIHALATIIAGLHDEEGRITVPGFYDDVRPVTEDDRAKIAAIPFDADAYKERLGVNALFGETGYNTHERAWARPTLEINGIWGGFSGEGMKTVLPSKAHCKITCRLVADQQPARIAQLVKAHVERLAPPGVTVNVTIFANAAYPYRMPSDDAGNRAARAVLEEMYGKEPYYTRTGGSVPLLTMFQTELGVNTVTFGFALPDENIHSPNEFWRLSSFRKAQTGYCMLLHELATVQAQ
jgi:acetylornithine deacetylase/succinyl-diaminopimelate desuccinylase-like protein